MDAPLRGKNTARTACRLAAVSCLLLVFVAVLLISTTSTVQSRQGLTSRQRAGSEFRAWRKDVLRPDRTTDMTPPPAPKANSNVPGGPFGR
ncbi:unnamed protein product [Miscanthus lutarioriparius]|uniref:Uncharacterized protein n=1 Tax=Miscanthus lutarioriparius TaxID=422564 RepID=A0A811RPT0_9POAL|nr:unnamed protein product [Miscanthus lutarioriparius]